MIASGTLAEPNNAGSAGKLIVFNINAIVYRKYKAAWGLAEAQDVWLLGVAPYLLIKNYQAVMLMVSGNNNMEVVVENRLC
jgi:hypothetical protein